jgi:hypothetical protein
MIRRILATAAAIAIIAACIAHLAGNESAAELAGDIGFFALLAALVMPERYASTGERGASANDAAQ